MRSINEQLGLVTQYIDRSWINWAIGWYFTLASLLACFQTFNTLVTYVTPGFLSRRLPSYSVLIKEDGIKVLKLDVPFLSLVGPLPGAIAVPWCYVVMDKPW